MVATTRPPFSIRATSQPSGPMTASSHHGCEKREMEGSCSQSSRYVALLLCTFAPRVVLVVFYDAAHGSAAAPAADSQQKTSESCKASTMICCCRWER